MASEQFKAARELVANKDSFCKYALARDSNGQTVSPSSNWAVRWCANGAMVKAGVSINEMGRFISFVNKQSGQAVASINDYKGRNSILRFMDRFIESTEDK